MCPLKFYRNNCMGCSSNIRNSFSVYFLKEIDMFLMKFIFKDVFRRDSVYFTGVTFSLCLTILEFKST